MKRKVQSIVEYTMLVVLISAAIAAMASYLQRAVNSRFKQVREEMNESQRGI